MRKLTASFLIFVLLLTGCKNADAPLDQAIRLRNRLLDSNGCSFQTTVTADYGQKLYKFSMDCQADKMGNLTFTVTAPTTIAGISGKIAQEGGAITFDDQVLAFQTIADGQVSPVTAPWLFLHTLRSGYLKGCAQGTSGIEISIDDSYAEEALHLKINTQDDIPVSAEIFWQGRRVLTLTVENFTYM